MEGPDCTLHQRPTFVWFSWWIWISYSTKHHSTNWWRCTYSKPGMKALARIWKIRCFSVHSALISSLSKTIMAHVVKCATTRGIWLSIERMFTSHSRARTMQMHYQLPFHCCLFLSGIHPSRRYTYGCRSATKWFWVCLVYVSKLRIRLVLYYKRCFTCSAYYQNITLCP